MWRGRSRRGGEVKVKLERVRCTEWKRKGRGENTLTKKRLVEKVDACRREAACGAGRRGVDMSGSVYGSGWCPREWCMCQ